MSDKKKESSAIAVLRIRGKVHLRQNIKDALAHLNLTRSNHLTIIKQEGSKRVLTKVNDYVTWGEIDETMIATIIKKRGKITGGKSVDDEYVKKHSKYADITSLSKAISRGECRLKDVEGLKPIFRLNPPLKGFERSGIKKNVRQGGALGYRGTDINKLIKRML